MTSQQKMKQKYDENAQNRTILPGMHVLVSQVAGLAGVDRSTRWLRGSCIGRTGSKLTVRLDDGRVIQRHLDQVVPDTSCGSRRAEVSDGLDDDSATAAASTTAPAPVTRPVPPAPSTLTGGAVSSPTPALTLVPAGSPTPAVAIPVDEAAPVPERRLSGSVAVSPAAEAPSVEAELPLTPRYNLRPRKNRATKVFNT